LKDQAGCERIGASPLNPMEGGKKDDIHVSELGPCPFCGSDEVFVNQAVQGSCWVICEALSCGASGPTRPTPAEASAAWNRRAFRETGAGSAAWPTDRSPAIIPETVMPMEIGSSRIGDIATFRASEVELVETFDRTRPCLGRARERITGDLILVQVSGGLQGGFAWAYAKHHRPHPQTRN
jgi:Lar family restriction alleviation protein